MSLLYNNGLGYTTGAAITTGGTGSGNGFTTTGGTAWLAGTDDQNIGQVGLVQQNLSAAGSFIGWNGLSATSIATRVGFVLTALGTLLGIINVRSASLKAANVLVMPNGKLEIQDTNAAETISFTTTLAINTLYWLEFGVLQSATAGTVKASLYDSTYTSIEAQQNSGAYNTGSAALNQVLFGQVASTTYAHLMTFYAPAINDGTVVAIGTPPTVTTSNIGTVPARTAVQLSAVVGGVSPTTAWTAVTTGAPAIFNAAKPVASIADVGAPAASVGVAPVTKTYTYKVSVTQPDGQTSYKNVTLSVPPARYYELTSSGFVGTRDLAGKNSKACNTIFGTQLTDTGSGRPVSQYNIGCRVGMLEYKQYLYQTADGVFDSVYEQQQVTNANTLKNAGLKLILSMGIQYQPAWLKSISNYTNQAGATSADANYIFNETVASKGLDNYIARQGRAGLIQMADYIRIGYCSSGELLYQQSAAAYWFYGPEAQTGADLNTYQTPCPFPNWVVGSASNNGVVMDTTKVTTLINWYIGCQVQMIRRMIDDCWAAGFTGRFQVLMPGQGARPDQVAADIAAFLPGGSSHLLTIGAAWHLVAAAIAALPIQYREAIDLYCSSTGDWSGTPTDNYTLPTDITKTLASPEVQSTGSGGVIWSAARFITWCANLYGFGMSGENTGFGGTTNFQTHFIDLGPTGILYSAAKQAMYGNWNLFTFAHSGDLYNGNVFEIFYGNVIYLAHLGLLPA
jgi:hypothetical protein